MSIEARSYVIDVPLGLGGRMEFTFHPDEGGAHARYVDSVGGIEFENPPPEALIPLTEAFFKTFLMCPRDDEDRAGAYEPEQWLDYDFWVQMTTRRLEEITEE